MSLLDDALTLAASGFPVFPCLANKRPAIKGGHGFHDASTEPERITELFVGPSATLIGIPTGEASGFDVLDIDINTRGMDWEYIASLPATHVTRTRSGGFHYRFIHAPGVRNSQAKLADGVDVRGDGGYVITAPSPGYEVTDDIPPVHWPDWLLALVLARDPKQESEPHQELNGANGAAPEPVSSQRLGAFVEKVIDRVRAAPDGSKHVTLRNAALSLGGIAEQAGITTEGTVRRLLEALPASTKDRKLAETTARWGLAQGATRPIGLPDRPYNGNGGAAPVYRMFQAAGASTENVIPSTDKPKASSEVAAFLATPFDPSLLETLEARKWVYGHFLIRRFLSVLGAPGGSGKTAYAMTIGVAVALNQAILLEQIHEPGPVWIYNLEDPTDELLRRLYAILLEHQIDPQRLIGQLYLDSGRDRPLVIATLSSSGAIVAEPVVDGLIAELQARKIKLFIVDPFVKSHRLEENRNEQIDFAAQQWSKVAEQADCAILLLHHFRKGGASGEADAFRGASALIDAARAAVSIAVMNEKEAERLGIDEEDRRFHFRVDNAKLNLAPPPTAAVWMKMSNVALPNGDQVQAVRRWEPPSPWNGIPMNVIVKILETIAAGPSEGEQFTLKTNGASKLRWAGTPLVEQAGVTEGQARDMVRAWVIAGVLVETLYYSASRRKEINGCHVDPPKVAEMRATVNDSGPWMDC